MSAIRFLFNRLHQWLNVTASRGKIHRTTQKHLTQRRKDAKERKEIFDTEGAVGATAAVRDRTPSPSPLVGEGNQKIGVRILARTALCTSGLAACRGSGFQSAGAGRTNCPNCPPRRSAAPPR